MLLIPDTNFLIYCSKYKIFHEFDKFHAELFLPMQVINELKKLTKDAVKGTDKEAAKLALSFIKEMEKKGKLGIEKSAEKKADDAIFELALSNKHRNVLVATHDKILMKKLKKAKITLLGIRQKKYLVKI